MAEYQHFKCLKCGKGFRTFTAGLSREAFLKMTCRCGSPKIVSITAQEYRELFGKTPKRKQVKRKVKKSTKYIPQFDLDDFLKELGEDVSAVTEKHAEAKQKEVKDGRKKKKKERKKSSGRDSGWHVVAR